MQPLLNKHALPPCRGGAGSIHEKIQFVQISLSQIARSLGVGVSNRDRYDPALFVIDDLGMACQIFGGVDPIPFVISVLKLESIDQVAGNCSASQQIHMKSTARPASKQACEQATHTVEPVACQSSKHCSACTRTLWRHDTSCRFVA